jgi:hypothetical protein
MDFEIISDIRYTVSFAQGTGIRELPRLQKIYGKGHWRKCKSEATVRLADGTVLTAEVHWYEAHGIGKREFKIKRYLE